MCHLDSEAKCSGLHSVAFLILEVLTKGIAKGCGEIFRLALDHLKNGTPAP